MIEAPGVTTYAIIISQETVHITLTIVVLSNLEVKASDIQNAYLTALCAEKIFIRLGPEI